MIGSTGRGRIGRTVPGTTADRLLHGAPCAVAVAPVGYRDRVPKVFDRIGAAVCTDPEAMRALEAAASLARAARAKLEVVGAFPGAAIERVHYGDLGAGEVVVNVRESAEADLQDATRALGEGVTATVHLFDGSPAKVLLDHAGELDLLVTGSRGYGPLGRVLLGSVSHEVIRQCPTPVLVVPRGNGCSVSHPAENGVGGRPV